MDNQSVQRRVFDLVLERFPKRSAAVSYLAGILSVGNNAIYRRMRGDSLLTLGELHLLAKHFGFSLDKIFFEEEENNIIFSYSIFCPPASSYKEYLDKVIENIQELKEMPNAQIYSSSRELPIFLYCSSPLLFAFKLYIYGLTYWKLEHLQDHKFNADLIPEAFNGQAEKITDVYQSMPSTELWNLGMIDTTLNQIEHLAAIDQFEQPQDALMICDSIRQLMAHARSMAEKGQKFSEDGNGQGTPLNLYHNSSSPANDTILINSDTSTIMYTSCGTPDFLATSDKKMCTQTAEWFESMVSRSTSITIHSGKERNQFFNGLNKRIDQAEKRINTLIE